MKLVLGRPRSFGKHTLTAALLIGVTFLNFPADAESLPTQPLPGAAQGLETPQLAPSKGVAEELQETQPAAEGNPAPDGKPAAGSNDVDKLDLHYLKGMFVDAGKMVSSPVHWDGQDWLKVGAVVGTTAGLMLFVDKGVKNLAQHHQNAVFSKFATLGNDLGNGTYTLAPVGAFYLFGYLTDDSKARKTALLALESFAISGAMTEGFKLAVGRHRPNTGDSPLTFDGPHLSFHDVSFSSGHTASAFSIATVFAEEYKDNAYVPPIAYGLATLTGLSRIYSNKHWLSDTFFGGALGYFVSKALIRYHEADKDSLLGRLSVMPQVGPDMTGLNVGLNF